MPGLSTGEMRKQLLNQYKKRVPGASRKSIIRFQNKLERLTKQELERLTKGYNK